MEQEKQVQEAEIIEEKNEADSVVEEEFESEIDRAKKRRRETIFEMALFLILGLLLGITIKTEAVKRITIGFNDYQLEQNKQRYDIEAIKKDLQAKADAEQAMQQQAAQQQQAAPQATSQSAPKK